MKKNLQSLNLIEEFIEEINRGNYRIIRKIINISEGTEVNHKKEISDNAKSAVLEVRKVELESIGQTKKINSEEDCPKKIKRNRRSNSEKKSKSIKKTERCNIKKN